MTTGEGGAISTDDDEIAEKARLIRNHGMSGRDQHVVLGFNNRMTEIEAAIGLIQLAKLDELNARRIANSEYLINKLSKLEWAKIPGLNKNGKHTYFCLHIWPPEQPWETSLLKFVRIMIWQGKPGVKRRKRA